MEFGPLQPSGRVIAGGRLLLSSLFLAAIWADVSQPQDWRLAVYTLLVAYTAWSISIVLLVWNNWWLDAKLAAPAHVVDVAAFMLMLYSTEGYRSPYFIFFTFILLAAAIRWGWKETAVTAGAIIVVYFTVGVLLGPSPEFEMEPFIVRTGNLLIISAILIWFGANQWVAWRRIGPSKAMAATEHADPYIAALQSGMAAMGARRGTLMWRDTPEEDLTVVRLSNGTSQKTSGGRGPSMPTLPGSLLFAIDKDRALMRAEPGRWTFLQASAALPADLRDMTDDGEGLAIPMATGRAQGLALFQDVRALSTDHLDFAPRIGSELAARIQEAALFAAIEDRSMAKARVAVARDLHDSVVQFLAGLGFRLEALKRAAPANGELSDSLAELKDTVMTEQRQLRAFVRGLRTGKPISLQDLTRDCRSLCQLLSRQWNIDCACACKAGGKGLVSLRTQLDVQHLIREAVANAVRHGQAGRVTVSMSPEEDQLCLKVVDNGTGFAGLGDDGSDLELPASLDARVKELRGKLEVESSSEETTVIIRLPMDDSE